MSESIKDGGQAFPHLEVTSRGEVYHDHLGMTLRDYFAAKAIPSATRSEYESPTYNGPSYKGIAERAYLLADAMIAARNSTKEKQ